MRKHVSARGTVMCKSPPPTPVSSRPFLPHLLQAEALIQLAGLRSEFYGTQHLMLMQQCFGEALLCPSTQPWESLTGNERFSRRSGKVVARNDRPHNIEPEFSRFGIHFIRREEVTGHAREFNDYGYRCARNL